MSMRGYLILLFLKFVFKEMDCSMMMGLALPYVSKEISLYIHTHV